MSGPTVLLAGGGTAGHIEPALALADALRRLRPRVAVTLLGTARGLETTLVPARGYPLELIPPVPLPRRPTGSLLLVPGRLAGSVRAAGRVLDRLGADVVVGFGGYVALPAYLAARRRRTPIVVHEANARPGLANRVGARLTTAVAVAAAGTSLPHARALGIPLRSSIAALDRAAVRPTARAELGLAADRPTLLVVGGSQGARSLNAAVAAAVPALLAAGVQVLHATGANNVSAVSASVTAAFDAAAPVERSAYVAVPYLARMDLAYAAADLALCRAGALTCAELTAVGLPAAYVPLPIGNGEQQRNVAAVIAAGGGLQVADARLSPQWIVDTVLPLLLDAPRLVAMGQAAARRGHRDADVALAELVLDVAGAR